MNKQSGSEMRKKEGGSGRRRDAPPLVQPPVRFGLAVSLFAVVLMSSIRTFAAESGGHAFEDTLADILTWVVMIVAPVVLIGLFLILHILPEKIAERRKHPQLSAIKTLCILAARLALGLHQTGDAQNGLRHRCGGTGRGIGSGRGRTEGRLKTG